MTSRCASGIWRTAANTSSIVSFVSTSSSGPRRSSRIESESSAAGALDAARRWKDATSFLAILNSHAPKGMRCPDPLDLHSNRSMPRRTLRKISSVRSSASASVRTRLRQKRYSLATYAS